MLYDILSVFTPTIKYYHYNTVYDTRQISNLNALKESRGILFFSAQNQPVSSHDDSSMNTPRGSCRECLITGVLTCTGLSAYFFHLASEIPEGNQLLTRQMKTNKYFLYGGSVAWATAGIYRLYLG